MPNMRDAAREARAAQGRCKSRGVSTTFFKSDDGNGRHGWNVCVLRYEGSNNYYEPGSYEDYWGNSEIFLGEDGRLYIHDFRGSDIGPGRSSTRQREQSESDRVYVASVDDLKDPVLALGVRKRYFVAVLEGLQALGN